MRPAMQFVDIANQYQSSITVSNGQTSVDGKSIMGLMTLAACVGTNLRIVANGPDEADAIAAITALVESGFNE